MHVSTQNRDNHQEFHASVSAFLQFSVNALKSATTNHSCFINVKILSNNKSQCCIALMDTGNSVQYDAVVKYDLCKELNLPILRKDIQIGSASQEHEIKSIGVCRFKLALIVNKKRVVYEMSAAVLSDLKDQINIGSHFLCKHNVNLEFSNDRPIKMHFKNIGYLESVSSIAPVTSPSKDHTEQLSKNNVLFSLVKNKIFQVKAEQNYYLAPNTITLARAYVEGAPLNNFCGIVLPNLPNHANPELCGGLLRRVVPLGCFSFEYKCL